MLSWLKRTFRRELGVDPEHGPVVVQGIQLRCYVCSHDLFWEKQTQLHTPFMTFMNLDAWNRVADCAICQKCGYIHWFLDPAVLARAFGDSEEDPAAEKTRVA